jgi:DNA topoisomerase-1
MKLIIVESPTKARTIQGFLGKSYQVVSSMGHVVDLPRKSFGVDIEKDFTPEYTVLKKEIATGLRKASKEAELVILAMDPDREGEAIAYHIKSLLKQPTKRALFYEITKKAVQASLEDLGTIDDAKFEAQQARRILDRIVGYQISPLLWQVFNNRSLSAGRVQSVALRLICEREKERTDFEAQEFWDIRCKFNDDPEFIAKLAKIKVTSEKEAVTIEKELKEQSFVVEAFTKRDKQRAPFAPYITSTLQQDASSKMKFGTKQTMMIAQQLFEGIELGKKGRVGLITYMRTDSLRVAGHAIKQARDYIARELPKEYLPPKARVYTKKKGAHEAIRPTSVDETPESLSQYLDPRQMKLYSMIWKRFVASQAANAVYEQRNMDITGGKYKLKAESDSLKFAGFTSIYHVELNRGELLPELSSGTELDLREVMKEQKFTQPKPAYTEGTMVKELESKGIGRPSTYAPTISRIIEKRYVNKIKGRLFPTELGETLNGVLVSHFPDIFDVGFTKEMEENLDKIESEETDRIKVLKTFYKPFEKRVTKFAEAKKEVKQEITKVTEEKCDLCGSPLLMKWGRFGTFLACSKYPDCKFTKAITLEIKCPECQAPMVERRTKKGKIFYGCSAFPKCHFAVWDKPVDKTCPSCGYKIMVTSKKAPKSKGKKE